MFTVTDTLTDRMQRLELVNSSVLGSVGNCGGTRIQSDDDGSSEEATVAARHWEWDHRAAATAIAVASLTAVCINSWSRPSSTIVSSLLVGATVLMQDENASACEPGRIPIAAVGKAGRDMSTRNVLRRRIKRAG